MDNHPSSLENRLAYRFSMLSMLNMRSIGGVYAKKFGLSSAGWKIMAIIGRYEPIFPSVAAEHTTMEADKVTRAVDRLVEMGYVVRNTDAADRRRVILCLTSKGRAVYEEVEAMHQDLDTQWRSTLSAEESSMLNLALSKLELKARTLFDPASNAALAVPVAASKRSSSTATAPRKRAAAKKAEAKPVSSARKR